MTHVVDTNALILDPDIIDEFEDIVIPATVLDELDRIKMESGERGQGARRAVRKIMDHVGIRYDLEVTNAHPDKAIIDCAARYSATLLTGDHLMYIRAKAQGVEAVSTFDMTLGKPDYTGYAEFIVDDEELAQYYSGTMPQQLVNANLVPNQYVVLNHNDKMVELLKVTSDFDLVNVKQVTFQSQQLGKIEPKDIYQTMAMDSLVNNKMTILKGRAGSGKSLLALSYAFTAIEKGFGRGKDKDKYDKIICFVNPVPTMGAAKLGFYPGSKLEKLLDSSVGSMLSAKLGERQEVERLVREGKMEILPFSDLRGYDTTGMKAVIWIAEAQNLTVDLIRIACQRVGEESRLIIDGDNKQQVDNVMYSGLNNGMRRVSEVFRGETYFGEIELPNIFRSTIAARADLL